MRRISGRSVNLGVVATQTVRGLAQPALRQRAKIFFQIDDAIALPKIETRAVELTAMFRVPKHLLGHVRVVYYSLIAESLVKAGSYNPAKRRAWTLEDAKQRGEEVKRPAQEDERMCELVLSLPKLEKRLQELQSS